MLRIGVILPSAENKNLWRAIKEKFKVQILHFSQYNIEFVAVSQRSNYAKIFRKKHIKHIVNMCEDHVSGDFKIIDGLAVFKRMLPTYIRKLVKTRDYTVTVADKNLTEECQNTIEELCSICPTIWISTQNKKMGEMLCDRLFEKYGVVINLFQDDGKITDIVAVLEDWDKSYGISYGIILNYEKNTKIIRDFYLPFSVKPPFGMSNIIFLECIEFAGK